MEGKKAILGARAPAVSVKKGKGGGNAVQISEVGNAGIKEGMLA